MSSVVTTLLVIKKTLMIKAAVVSSLFGAADATRRMRGRVVGSPWMCGMTCHTRLEAGQAERQLREDQQRDADDHPRVPMLLGNGRASSPTTATGCAITCPNSVGDDDDVQAQVDHHQDAPRQPMASLNPRRNTAPSSASKNNVIAT